MKPVFLTATLAGTLLVATVACTPQPSEPQTSAPVESPTTQSPSATPEAKPTLLTYDGPAQKIPVKAQYPNTMEVSGTGSGEGVGVFFTFKPQANALDEAEVHVFLPAGVATAAEQEPFVTGPNGLIANNGWVPDSTQASGSPDFSYPWVEKIINFSSDKEQSGHVLLGQTNGQAVQVTLLYPAEMADAYWPAANTILDSLTFEPSLLPVTTSPL
ncbi:MAG TPA: hypothetical protein IGR64_06020 [Leptolyngbyaceae cyanobacterium M65_K2018_010]|nr:hypothetical protein [Leptolyngbyaceae cyanobacterium M65_K2018_010]